MSVNEQTYQLLVKIHSGEATPAELDEWLALLKADESGEVSNLINLFYTGENNNEEVAGYDRAYWSKAASEILQADKGTMIVRRSSVRIYRYLWPAAALLALLLTGVVLWQMAVPSAGVVTNVAAPIPPGTNKAVLTLANGSRIVLDNTGESNAVIQQNGVKVIRLDSGLIAYQAQENQETSTAVPEYNTLSTPSGGQFKLILQDGTRVWLNAGSSLRFPVRLTGNRRVRITGEAYFEVSKGLPFTVETPSDSIQVLGTHFNINAYTNEGAVTTTLLEGRVKIGNNILQPGQQYQKGKVTPVNTEPVVAWVHGNFYFTQADIAAVMRQVARWYDIDVVYEGGSSKDKFSGSISREANLNELLRILEYSGVHSKLQGKQLTVIP